MCLCSAATQLQPARPPPQMQLGVAPLSPLPSRPGVEALWDPHPVAAVSTPTAQRDSLQAISPRGPGPCPAHGECHSLGADFSSVRRENTGHVQQAGCGQPWVRLPQEASQACTAALQAQIPPRDPREATASLPGIPRRRHSDLKAWACPSAPPPEEAWREVTERAQVSSLAATSQPGRKVLGPLCPRLPQEP